MPSLSMFYGILIFMNRVNEHNPPHFHATYQDFEASFDMDGKLIAGKMPLRQRRLIVAWVTIHHDELLANWELAQKGEELYKIDPLR